MAEIWPQKWCPVSTSESSESSELVFILCVFVDNYLGSLSLSSKNFKDLARFPEGSL